MTQWPSDADGSLRSDVLGLRLVVRGNLLRAQTAEGEILRTLQEAEDEVLRLRQELERLRRDGVNRG